MTIRWSLVLPSVLAALVASLDAHAGERSALSSLPVLPKPRAPKDPPKEPGVAGLKVKEVTTVGAPYLEITAATTRGYCIVSRQWHLRLEASAGSPEEEMELWRLTESDDKATLESTIFEIDKAEKTARFKGRSSIELRTVARDGGVTVWGFRDAVGDVTLLARGATSGRELPGLRGDDGSFPFVSSDCAFGAVRLSGKAAKTGTIAQLGGELPPVGEGKDKVKPHFVVDMSIAKLSRDPEPLLAVSVHVRQRDR